MGGGDKGSLMLPALDTASGAIHWNSVARLMDMIRDENSINKHLRYCLKTRLTTGEEYRALNTLTVLHTISLNGSLTVRKQLADGKLMKLLEKVFSSASGAIPVAVGQMLVDWAFMYSAEDLGQKSSRLVKVLRSKGDSFPMRATAVAAERRSEMLTGIRVLRFMRGMDFGAKDISSSLSIPDSAASIPVPGIPAPQKSLQRKKSMISKVKKFLTRAPSTPIKLLSRRSLTQTAVANAKNLPSFSLVNELLVQLPVVTKELQDMTGTIQTMVSDGGSEADVQGLMVAAEPLVKKCRDLCGRAQQLISAQVYNITREMLPDSGERSVQQQNAPFDSGSLTQLLDVFDRAQLILKNWALLEQEQFEGSLSGRSPNGIRTVSGIPREWSVGIPAKGPTVSPAFQDDGVSWKLNSIGGDTNEQRFFQYADQQPAQMMTMRDFVQTSDRNSSSVVSPMSPPDLLAVEEDSRVSQLSGKKEIKLEGKFGTMECQQVSQRPLESTGLPPVAPRTPLRVNHEDFKKKTSGSSLEATKNHERSTSVSIPSMVIEGKTFPSAQMHRFSVSMGSAGSLVSSSSEAVMDLVGRPEVQLSNHAEPEMKAPTKTELRTVSVQAFPCSFKSASPFHNSASGKTEMVSAHSIPPSSARQPLEGPAPIATAMTEGKLPEHAAFQGHRHKTPSFNVNKVLLKHDSRVKTPTLCLGGEGTQSKVHYQNESDIAFLNPPTEVALASTAEAFPDGRVICASQHAVIGMVSNIDGKARSERMEVVMDIPQPSNDVQGDSQPLKSVHFAKSKFESSPSKVQEQSVIESSLSPPVPSQVMQMEFGNKVRRVIRDPHQRNARVSCDNIELGGDFMNKTRRIPALKVRFTQEHLMEVLKKVGKQPNESDDQTSKNRFNGNFFLGVAT